MQGRETLVNIYNLNGEKILDSITLRDASEKLDIPLSTIRNAYHRGSITRGKYRIEKVGPTNPEPRTKKKQAPKPSKEEIFKKEWEDAVAPFRNVRWVKNGGRRLEFKR